MAQSDIDALAIPKSPGDIHDYLERAVAAALRGSVGTVLAPLVDAPLTHDLTLRRGAGTITFTRAGTATYWDRYGVRRAAAADVPRFESAGLLIEGASTNSVAYSEPASAGQVYTSSGVTFRAAILFSGAGFSTEVYFPDATVNRYCYWAVTGLTVGQVYTQSVFVKTADGSAPVVSGSFDLTMRLDTAPVIPVVTRIGSSSIYRLSYTWTATSTSAQIGIAKLTDSTAKAFAVTGMQLELLKAASSYIQTAGSAASRAADVCNLTYSGNLPPPDRSAMTVNADVDVIGSVATSGGGQTLFYATGEGLDGRWMWPMYSGGSLYAKYGTVAALSGNIVETAKAGYRNGYRQDGSKIAAFVNGAKVGENTNAGTITGSATSIQIGGFGASYHLFGHVRNLRIWDRALSDTEMLAA